MNHDFINDIIDDIINTYFDNDLRHQVLLYFRLFYVLKILMVITDELGNARNIILKLITEIKANDGIIAKNLLTHFDYLYDIFFDNDNVYFDVYFNNVIKYCLPYPYDVEIYSPYLTFRSNVETFYKKNNVDYLDSITTFDTTFVKSPFGAKNINAISNEIDVHIPIKYIDTYMKYICALKNVDIIYFVGTPAKLYIATKFVCNVNSSYTLDIIYTRTVLRNIDKLQKNIPFELLFDEWKMTNMTINVGDVVYVSVNRKLTADALLRVFSPMQFNKSKYKYLFHNTSADTIDNRFVANPLYTYLSPYMGLCDAYMGGRKCIVLLIKKNIKNVLDLTQSIIVDNPFIYHLKKKDEHAKKWLYYDNTRFMEYYDNKQVPVTTNTNNKCISIKEDDDMNIFMSQRQYCDVGTKRHYNGIRKLQEILFKTRKYHPGMIWIYIHFKDTYQKMGYDTKLNLLYHSKSSTYSTNMDKHVTDILYRIGSVGYFATDHEFAFKNGGELLLARPSEFLIIHKKSNKMCKYKDAFDKMT